MNIPKTVAIVGYKNTGKTQVVEALVRELSDRGFRVGTLKHTVEEAPLDTPGKDTWRHMEAGAVSTAILGETTTAFFHRESFKVKDALENLGNIDFLVLEGFKSLKTVSRIIVLENPSDIDLINGLELAFVPKQSTKLDLSTSVPLVSLSQVEKLGDIVEKNAFPILQGHDCGKCGYKSCSLLGKALILGEADVSKCFHNLSGGVAVKVNGENMQLNNYVQNVFQNILLGLIKTLKLCKPPQKIEVSFEVDEVE
jgi:molybdopterin-guanine dinucleotide biosynthesis protein B